MEAAPDTSKDRGSPASGARQEAPVTGNIENTQTDAQGGLCGTAITKSENNHEVAILTQGYSAQKGVCRLEAQLGDSLVQNTSKQDLNSNESKKRIFQPGITEDRSKCTFTGRKTLENMHKPIVLKELRKLWNNEEPGLPWDEGDISPSNTLLVDDSPYKALRNPPHTAIFPHPFTYLNWNDNSLGPVGDLRVYLQNLIFADDVECYVRNHPFGQPFITQNDPHWNFYAEIAGEGYGSLTCCA